MHMEQSFVDNLDAYVWIYDPIPFYYWVIGTLIVFGGIGICLFPLWPPQVRYAYYFYSLLNKIFNYSYLINYFIF